jgi:hypothetical protein
MFFDRGGMKALGTDTAYEVPRPRCKTGLRLMRGCVRNHGAELPKSAVLVGMEPKNLGCRVPRKP